MAEKGDAAHGGAQRAQVRHEDNGLIYQVGKRIFDLPIGNVPVEIRLGLW